MPEHGVGRLLALLLVLTGLVLLGGGAWWTLDPPPRAPARVVLVADRPPAGLVAGELFVPVVPPVPVPGVPVHIDVPALGVHVPVVPVRASGGTLRPPNDPFELGWWADGAQPGAAAGVALLTGHTVHDGPGALNSLGRLRPGETVRVRTDTSLLVYRVVSVQAFSKGRLAQRSQELFASDGPGRLALVTCSDWDGTRYLTNTVVTAVPL